MRFRDGFRPCEFRVLRIIREIAQSEFAVFWRELARPVTFFDLCSLPNVIAEEIGEFPRKSAPGRTRTCDPRLRRPVLYPTELRAHGSNAARVTSGPVWRPDVLHRNESH